jgi:hypothetical protein
MIGIVHEKGNLFLFTHRIFFFLRKKLKFNSIGNARPLFSTLQTTTPQPRHRPPRRPPRPVCSYLPDLHELPSPRALEDCAVQFLRVLYHRAGVRRGARGLQAKRESGAASVEHGAMFREAAAGRRPGLTVHKRCVGFVMGRLQSRETFVDRLAFLGPALAMESLDAALREFCCDEGVGIESVLGMIMN